MISRNQILGIGLAVGILLAGGTGLASADSSPATTPPPTTPAAAPTCDVVVLPGKAIPATPLPSKPVPCLKLVRGGLPSGAPQTGGGGMAAEVSSWG